MDGTRLLIWKLTLKVCSHRLMRSSTWKNKHFHSAPPGQITCTRAFLTKFVGELFKVLHQHHQHVPAHEKMHMYIFLSCTEPSRYVLKIQLHCIPSPWSSPLHRTSGNWSEAPLFTSLIYHFRIFQKYFKLSNHLKEHHWLLLMCLDHSKTLILPPVIQAWLLPRYKCFYKDKWSTPVLCV